MVAAERYGGGAIVVRDYDPLWPSLFEDERASLVRALGPLALTIEHVGSTAVAGLAAKPIIDVLVGVRSLAAARPACVERLPGLGYVHVAEAESWLPDELLFRKGPPGPWTHHVHVMELTSPRWDEFVLVRDYLRRHPEVARAYGELKKAIALVFGDDIAGFRSAKAPFVQRVLAQARADLADRDRAAAE
jgi:GrpB-like predicted nucleotidyltransferase (UPF0157 family)